MVRRFPVSMHQEMNMSSVMFYILAGVAAVGVSSFILRELNEDNKLEVSQRHHPKGVGFTNINKQMQHLRNITKKIVPHIDENYYEYSRHNPTRQR